MKAVLGTEAGGGAGACRDLRGDGEGEGDDWLLRRRCGEAKGELEGDDDLCASFGEGGF